LKRLLYAAIILDLFIVVDAQAKWIAKTDTRTLHYDSYGKQASYDVSKEALAVYDKASACLQYLRVKFNEDQKSLAEMQVELDKVSPNSFWFKAQFPTMESKSFSNGTLGFRITTSYSCEEKRE